MTLIYFMARSNLVPYAFVWEKGKTMSFSETIVVYDLKLATDDLSDKKFLFTSKLCPLGAVCSLPWGYIDVLNQEKNCIKSDVFILNDNSLYCNYPKFSDRHAWANSADPDLGAVCMVWTHYSMVEPHSSNFRAIITNFLGVRILRKFTVNWIFMRIDDGSRLL